ncbi:MAG: hypothetical protein QF408_14525 [Pirellulales bacterium]|nr:hypothetical protein [Pirellulales bacterium]
MFFKDPGSYLPGVLLDGLVYLEEASPADEDVFDSTSQCRPLRLVNLQISKIEYQPVARTLFGADALNKVKI